MTYYVAGYETFVNISGGYRIEYGYAGAQSNTMYAEVFFKDGSSAVSETIVVETQNDVRVAIDSHEDGDVVGENVQFQVSTFGGDIETLVYEITLLGGDTDVIEPDATNV